MFLEQYYLSSLLFTKVISGENRVLGKTLDLQVDLDFPQPEVIRLLYRAKWSSEIWSVSWDNVENIVPNKKSFKPGTVLSKS